MQLNGIKKNKCFLAGVQGVCSLVEQENTTGQSAIFAINGPENNSLFVLKEFSSGVFGLLPEDPTPDYNFKITLQKTNGFLGTLNGIIQYYTTDVNASGGTPLTIKWNDPAFDITANYTVLHFHIWHDGINWCGMVDGYI